MKAHLEPTDWGRRGYKIIFYADGPSGTTVFTFTGPDGWSTWHGNQDIEWQQEHVLELPREAIEALVEAALRERLGVGELDTLVIEELRQQRARVDKLIDHIIAR